MYNLVWAKRTAQRLKPVRFKRELWIQLQSETGISMDHVSQRSCLERKFGTCLNKESEQLASHLDNSKTDNCSRSCWKVGLDLQVRSTKIASILQTRTCKHVRQFLATISLIVVNFFKNSGMAATLSKQRR